MFDPIKFEMILRSNKSMPRPSSDNPFTDNSDDCKLRLSNQMSETIRPKTVQTILKRARKKF